MFQYTGIGGLLFKKNELKQLQELMESALKKIEELEKRIRAFEIEKKRAARLRRLGLKEKGQKNK